MGGGGAGDYERLCNEVLFSFRQYLAFTVKHLFGQLLNFGNIAS